MADFGIRIAAPGKNTDTSANLVMNTAYPFWKLDTQTATGFQTIQLLITNDPPEPVGPATHTYTVVYSFTHGYSYIPSIEHLFYVSSPPPGTNFYQTYFQDSGIIGAHSSGDYANLYAVADASKVYFIVDKFDDGFTGSPNLLTGTVIQITSHVFADDCGI